MPIFPPRPKSKISWTNLVRYERSKQWIVQRKFNGTRNTIHISSAGDVSFFSRHQRPHRQFTPSAALIDEIRSLNLAPGQEYWLDSELMHAKTRNPAYKGKIVLYDVLHAGRPLVMSPNQMGRLSLLAEICRHPTELEPNLGIALKVTKNIWMAETFEANFIARFKDFLDADEIEGLVLRQKKSILGNMGTKYWEASWVVRCRKPHKNYTL